MSLLELTKHLKRHDINHHHRELVNDAFSHDVYKCKKTGRRITIPLDTDLEPEFIDFCCFYFDIEPLNEISSSN